MCIKIEFCNDVYALADNVSAFVPMCRVTADVHLNLEHARHTYNLLLSLGDSADNYTFKITQEVQDLCGHLQIEVLNGAGHESTASICRAQNEPDRERSGCGPDDMLDYAHQPSGASRAGQQLLVIIAAASGQLTRVKFTVISTSWAVLGVGPWQTAAEPILFS